MRDITLKTGGALFAAILAFPVSIPAQTATLTVIHSFTGGDDGWGPSTGVTIGAGGVLYGATAYAGTHDQGTAFSFTPPTTSGAPWTESVYSLLHGGGGPVSGTLAAAEGGSVLFGSILGGGDGGAVLSLRPPSSPGGSWSENFIHHFTGYPNDGFDPNPVVVGSGGVLYGTTQYGGNGGCDEFVEGCGVVYALTPPASPGAGWTETILYNFTGYPNDGNEPTANLVIGSGGVLYGTTNLGGSNNTGTVFSLTPPASPGGQWTEAVLYSYPSLLSGWAPGQLALGSDGVLYGITAGGPALYGTGAAFSLKPPSSAGAEWTQTTLYAFGTSANDGTYPNSLRIGHSGLLYGTCSTGGMNNSGVVFELKPSGTAGAPWTETILYNFTGGSDGASPEGVVMGPDGIFYGAAQRGGITNFGTVFSLTP